jgi:twitching motility two-component system response regulator PilH
VLSFVLVSGFGAERPISSEELKMARILVVDDSAYQRSKARRILEEAGHVSLEAINGRDGLERIVDDAPDCVLLDLLMPELDGIEVLREVRDQGITTPVVVVTADVQDTTRQLCMELGAAAVIHKPVKRDELIGAIDRFVKLNAGNDEENG